MSESLRKKLSRVYGVPIPGEEKRRDLFSPSNVFDHSQTDKESDEPKGDSTASAQVLLTQILDNLKRKDT